VACVCSRGYINGSGGRICRRLASPVACGVSTAAVDPTTSWDEPGCPSLGLAVASLLETVVPHRSHRGAESLLETVVPHRSRRGAASLLETAHCPRLAAARLQAVARDESGVDNFRIRSESESELCEFGEEFLISMWMWIIRIRLCANADADLVLAISDGYGLCDN
jgi:hypothetical protein